MEMNPVTKMNTILVVCAMEAEENAIINGNAFSFKEHIAEERLGIKYKEISFPGNKTLLISRSGIGNINAALNIAFISKERQIHAIVLLGVAGSLRHNLNIGDIIVASEIIKHDSVFTGHEGKELMAPGELFLSLSPEERKSPHLKTSNAISNWIFHQIEELELKDTSVHMGVVMSGDEFAGNKERKIEISQMSKASLAVEMEAAGVAVICNKLNIPFITIKTIADRLNPETAISNEYKDFLQSAADNTKIVLELLIKDWRKNNEE